MSVYPKLCQERLREIINYEPDTGFFYWKFRRKGIRVGKKLGTNNGYDYLRITVDGTSHYAHRLAWLYSYGEFPDCQIDHINGDRKDNRIANLRSVTSAENQQNKKNAQSNNKTGLLGVSWHAKAGKWQAHISVSKKHKYLGLFDNKDDAHQSYLKAKKEYHSHSTIGA